MWTLKVAVFWDITHLETQYHFQQTVDCWIEAQCSSEIAVWLPEMLKQCSVATFCSLTVLLISHYVHVAEW